MRGWYLSGDDDRSYTTAMCVLTLEVYYRYFTPLLAVEFAYREDNPVLHGVDGFDGTSGCAHSDSPDYICCSPKTWN